MTSTEKIDTVSRANCASGIPPAEKERDIVQFLGLWPSWCRTPLRLKGGFGGKGDEQDQGNATVVESPAAGQQARGGAADAAASGPVPPPRGAPTGARGILESRLGVLGQLVQEEAAVREDVLRLAVAARKVVKVNCQKEFKDGLEAIEAHLHKLSEVAARREAEIEILKQDVGMYVYLVFGRAISAL